MLICVSFVMNLKTHCGYIDGVYFYYFIHECSPLVDRVLRTASSIVDNLQLLQWSQEIPLHRTSCISINLNC